MKVYHIIKKQLKKEMSGDFILPQLTEWRSLENKGWIFSPGEKREGAFSLKMTKMKWGKELSRNVFVPTENLKNGPESICTLFLILCELFDKQQNNIQIENYNDGDITLSKNQRIGKGWRVSNLKALVNDRPFPVDETLKLLDEILISPLTQAYCDEIDPSQYMVIKIPLNGMKAILLHKDGSESEWIRLVPLAVISDKIRIGIFKKMIEVTYETRRKRSKHI